MLDNVHIMIAMGKRCAKGIQPQYYLIVISFYEWGAIPPGSSIKESLFIYIFIFYHIQAVLSKHLSHFKRIRMILRLSPKYI